MRRDPRPRAIPPRVPTHAPLATSPRLIEPKKETRSFGPFTFTRLAWASGERLAQVMTRMGFANLRREPNGRLTFVGYLGGSPLVISLDIPGYRWRSAE